MDKRESNTPDIKQIKEHWYNGILQKPIRGGRKIKYTIHNRISRGLYCCKPKTYDTGRNK